jgi:transcriptional regulator with XRE-family HTH domain
VRRVCDKIARVLIGRVAENTKRLRAEQGLTLKALGRRAGLHWRHVQKIEAEESNLTLVTLARLARGLSVDGAELLAKPR